MAINIKSPDAEAAVRDLAAATGEGLTEAIQKAAEERLARIRQGKLRNPTKPLSDRLRPLQDLVAAERRKGKEVSSAKDLLEELYDEHGLPR